MISEQEISKQFDQGLDCSMIVLHEVADKIGMSGEEAYRLASCFGVGMMQGSLCGAVSAGFMAIGAKYGNSGPDQMDQKGLVMAKREEFLKRFNEKYAELTCPGLIQLDLRKPEDMKIAGERKLFVDFCPKVCRCSIEILNEML